MSYQPGHEQPQQPGYPGTPGYGPYAQPGWVPPPPPPNTTMALVAHIGSFVGGFLVPLIIYVTAKDDPFARRHAAEALNAQLTYTGITILAVFCLFASMFLAAFGMEGAVLSIVAMIVFFVAIFGFMIFYMVCSVIGMMRASRREEYRYPLTIRFVKG